MAITVVVGFAISIIAPIAKLIGVISTLNKSVEILTTTQAQYHKEHEDFRKKDEDHEKKLSDHEKQLELHDMRISRVEKETGII